MSTKPISGGVVHQLPADFTEALRADPVVAEVWERLTPLARNEWICWVISVKREETRKEHIRRACAELHEGAKRPCCWIGCIHRTDKKISPSVQYILNKNNSKRS